MLGASQAAVLGSAYADVLYDTLVLDTFKDDVVSYWKFQNDGVDQVGRVHSGEGHDATITGRPELHVASIVRFDPRGECIAWPGTPGVYAEVEHDSAHKTDEGTIVVTFQHDSLRQKSTLVAADANAAAGGLSMEVLPNGAPRCYLRRRSDGNAVILVGQPGDAQPNKAYTLIFKWGRAGLSMTLWPENRDENRNENRGFVRRQSDALKDGLTDSNSPVRFGAWHTDASQHDGPYGRVIWLKRQIPNAEEAFLAQAKTIVRDGSSAVRLSAIYMWADYEGNGERKVTDTAIDGTIASSSGGTLPAFPITVDPTPYVQNARGSKDGWSAQFQNSTKGTWTRLGSGDFQFTPGTSAGYDDSQYRVSDDRGTTWSAWQTIESLVLDRSLCPGPYFLIEDYGGDNQAKIEAARDAADAAGGGTVTTIKRSTVLTDVAGLQIRPNVHWLFLNIKRADSKWTDNSGCTPTGNGQSSGWRPSFHTALISGEENRRAIVDSGNRIYFLGGIMDCNMFKQALYHTTGSAADPYSNSGTCYPGVRQQTKDFFNLQHNPAFKLRGKDSSAAADRELVGVYGMYIFNSTSDGIRGVGAVDLIAHDNIFSATARGAFVMDGGNSKLRTQRNRILAGINVGGYPLGAGIDHEMLLYSGSGYGDYVHQDDFIEQDFDMVIRFNSPYTFSGCTIGPGLNARASNADGAVCTIQGSAANPRAKVRYHCTGGGAGGSRPGCLFAGWSRRSPYNITYKFIDTDFITWGTPYPYHEKLLTPAAGQTWAIDFGDSVETAYAYRIEVTNCTASVGPNMPSGSKTLLLFKTVQALTTTQVVRIDGLTIGSGFAQDAVRLNGQRLEYRNVSHEGFPSATIQQICPGAGEYVPI